MLLSHRSTATGFLPIIMVSTVLLLGNIARPVRARAMITAFGSISPTTNGVYDARQQEVSISKTATNPQWQDLLSSTIHTLIRVPPKRRHFSFLSMSSDDIGSSCNNNKTLESEWDLQGLKQEVSRVTMRTHKKVDKTSMKLRKAKEMVDKLRANENATMAQLEACPNVDAIEHDLQEIRKRLQQLNQLNELLLEPMNHKNGKLVVLPEETAQLALELGVDDAPPQRQPRGPKKQKKGPRQKNPPKTRLPYRRFYTVDKTEIRVCSTVVGLATV